MAGETVAPPSSGATRTPSSGSKAKGYSDLKSRLQKLQESPSFAVPAASTPASARSTGEWAVHSARSARAPHSAAAVATPPSVSSAGQHPAAEWTVLSARDAGSSGRPPLPDTRASAPALISPVSLYNEVHDPSYAGANGTVPSSRPAATALSFDHLAPTPGPSQHAPMSAAELAQSPVTAKGQEILEETEGILDALSSLPAAEQVRVLESRLRASATMYDQLVQENMRLAKERELAEQERDEAKEMTQRLQGLPPDVVSQDSPVANRQELSLMQQQMSATCQELITARKTLREKEAALKSTEDELAQAQDKLVQAQADAVAQQQATRVKLDQADADAREIAKLNEDQRVFLHEKNLLMTQLDKAHNDIVDLKVRSAELERLAANGEKAMAERDELKDECRELTSSNSRMGEKIAELVSKNGELEQQINTLRGVVMQGEVDMAHLKKTIQELESIVDRLERINKEQEDSFTAQLADAAKALEESQEQLRVINEKWEQLLAEKEYLQDRMTKLEYDMRDLQLKNKTLAKQNHKLAVDMPHKLKTQLDILEEQSQDAKAMRDKQVRLLQRRLEKRDLEIFHLRSVWRVLLTSHPDLDRAGDAMVGELRVANQENQKLERQLAEEQEQKDGLMITVAISYLKLVLANWRRPLYKQRLAESLKQSADIEEQLEEWERYHEEQEAYDANATFSITADVEPYHGGARSHEPDMLMQKMMGQPVSPPATSFGTAPASVPKGSSNHALRTVGAVQVQEDEEGEEAVAEEEYDARQLTRQRALEEGRRKYMRPAPAPQQGQPHRDHAAHEPSPLSTHQHGDDDISPMPSPPPSFSAPRTSKIQRSAPPLSDDRAAGGEIGDAGVARATDEATGRSLNRITIADRGLALETAAPEGKAKVDIDWGPISSSSSLANPVQNDLPHQSPAGNSMRSSSPSSPSVPKDRPVTPRHWLTGKEDLPADRRWSPTPVSPDGHPMIEHPALNTPRGQASPWLQQALGRSGHIPSPLARPLPTTPRANYPHAGGGGRSPYINVSGGGTGPLGPRVTQDAWNGGGAGMLDELGMGESGTGYAEGTGSGYTDFSAQRGTRKEAPTPPPRNASAQKRVPHVQDRVNL